MPSATVGDFYQVLTNGFGIDYLGASSPGYNVLTEGWWNFSLNPAERSVLRNLLKFDDMLIMLTGSDIKDGICGYRAGQKVHSTDDFIEFVS